MKKSEAATINGEAPAQSEAEEAAPEASRNGPDLATTVVTVGVIGVGAALIEAALIPGMIIGACAMLVPKAVPRLGQALQPAFRATVRGTYKLGRKARHAVAEAHEQVQDIVAETHAEATTAADKGAPGA